MEILSTVHDKSAWGRESVECRGEWEWDMGRGVMSASHSITH